MVSTGMVPGGPERRYIIETIKGVGVGPVHQQSAQTQIDPGTSNCHPFRKSDITVSFWVVLFNDVVVKGTIQRSDSV